MLGLQYSASMQQSSPSLQPKAAVYNLPMERIPGYVES